MSYFEEAQQALQELEARVYMLEGALENVGDNEERISQLEREIEDLRGDLENSGYQELEGRVDMLGGELGNVDDKTGVRIDSLALLVDLLEANIRHQANEIAELKAGRYSVWEKLVDFFLRIRGK